MTTSHSREQYHHSDSTDRYPDHDTEPMARRALRLMRIEDVPVQPLPPELSVAISARLEEEPLWQEVPKYGEYDTPESEAKELARLDSIAEAILNNVTSQEQRERAQEAINITRSFIETSFGYYNGTLQPELPTSFVFAAPSRVSRSDRGAYVSEVMPFLPVAEFIDSNILQRLVAGLPPCIVESYTPENDEQGSVVSVPLLEDMRRDLQEDPQELARVAWKVINDTARFVRERLGARVMGLGAILPRLTDFGQIIHQEGLETTTGHGGTVYLISETVKKVIEETSIDAKESIGIIGAGGSIGRGSLALLAEEFPSKTFVLHDYNDERLAKAREFCETHGINVEIATSNKDVLERTNLVVSAVTRPVELGEENELDLSGKVIIDDSQPARFNRNDVERLGGSLVWVVGEVPAGPLSREGGYTFGDTAGLAGPRDAWGCELEAATIALREEYELALREPVTPESARAIGQLFRKSGVKVAQFQSYGQPVVIP